jgi:hypothetical protein
MGILRGNQHMWAWFRCRTSPKDICDVAIWPIHRVLLFIELCGANRPCIWPTSVLQKWACPMTKQFPVYWTSLARVTHLPFGLLIGEVSMSREFARSFDYRSPLAPSHSVLCCQCRKLVHQMIVCML